MKSIKMKKYKILLSGGGSGGPVTPLLAVADEFKKNKEAYDFFWIGTKNGPEKQMVEREGIEFESIFSGKLRRYFSLLNFIDLFLVFLGFLQSILILLKKRPNLIMSAGGFVSVPMVWAAGILRIPVLIHQQDIRPGLANKLMAPFARVITVTFEKSLKDYGKKAIWVGNPVRNRLEKYKMTKREAIKKLGLNESLPVVLILGGGTGSLAINKLIEESLPELTGFCQIVHIAGKGKILEQESVKNYKVFEFLDLEGMVKVYTVADLVVSRCGMGVLTELSILGKSAILIPMPDTHQEDNAEIFSQEKAAIVLHQKNINAKIFASQIKQLLKDKELQKELSLNIQKVMKKNAGEEIVKIIKERFE